jgi:hypothetical protein
MKGSGRKGNRGRERPTGSEWVGGQVLAPFYVTEGGPFRPEMILWLEMPDEFILNATVVDPKGPAVSFSEALVQAMKSPMVGPPRRPQRIRVAGRRLAEEIRGAARGIEIVVAPTPEIDQVLERMAESFPDEGGEKPSYLEGGRVSPEVVEALFEAAEGLLQAAPWKLGGDMYLIRLDIPRLGVEGECVSIIGSLGESLGFVIFPSLEAYDRFVVATEEVGASKGLPELGTPTLSLNFDRGADLPARMRREVSQHGWPVAGPDAYPWVQKRDRDGVLAPLAEHDVRIVSACAKALTSFFAKHGRLFESEDFEPLCESYFDEKGLEVRLTVPCEAGPLFEVNDSGGLGAAEPTGRVKVGRNAPCPCGSGKKYKKCCLGKDEAASKGSDEPALAVPEGKGAPLHKLDERLVNEMMPFAVRRFDEAFRRARCDFRDEGDAVQLFIPWFVYHFLIQGKPVVQWFLEERGSSLSDASRAWLEAQQATWLSVWEVTAVEPERGRLSLKDLLSDEERIVEEVKASRTLVRRDAVLGRVVDYGGMSVLCGLYPRSLPPREAAEVVRKVRGRLRRKRAVPLERLRDERIGRYMINLWEEAVEEMLLRRQIPPRLQNTDGEDLLFTIDHFSFEPAALRRVEASLESIGGAERPDPDDPDRTYRFVRAGNPTHGGLENTITGTVKLTDGKLRLETNSIRRADRLRAQIEAACGELVQHRMREHSDPSALLKQGEPFRPRNDQPSLIPPEEAARVVREFKERHYAAWLDLPIPHLGGRTPRESVRTREGKARVGVLLKEMENHESRLPEDERFSFSGIRRQLGLDP